MSNKKEKEWYSSKPFLKGYDEQKYKAHMDKVIKDNVSFNSYQTELQILSNSLWVIDEIFMNAYQNEKIPTKRKDLYACVLSLSIMELLSLFISRFTKDIVRLKESKTKEFYDSFSIIFSFTWNRAKHSFGNIHEHVNGEEMLAKAISVFEQNYKMPKDFSQFMFLIDEWQEAKDWSLFEIQKQNLGNYSFAAGFKPIATTYEEFKEMWKTLPQYPNYLGLYEEMMKTNLNPKITKEMKSCFNKWLKDDDAQLAIIGISWQSFMTKLAAIMRKLFKLEEIAKEEFKN